MSPPYELIPHTADLELRVTAGDLAALYGEAVTALFDVMINRDAVREAEKRLLSVEESATDLRLKALLDEALYLFEIGEFAGRSARVVGLEGDRLHVEVRGERYDPARHGLRAVIKAVTFNELRVEPAPEGWAARFVCDL
ncbi:MAG: archease [Planctomycetota bacterium]